MKSGVRIRVSLSALREAARHAAAPLANVKIVARLHSQHYGTASS